MTEKYFASANGYCGFRSYFKEIFAEEDLSRFFILKGGPGTGKSTFMKKIAEELSERVDSCELILCSSDKDSLDGVILSTANGRVAIVDGTAPHTVDPKFPGAVSEIINLGEGWNTRGLTDRRNEVKALTRAKGEEYSQAYEALALAGKVNDRISSITVAHFDKKRADTAARILLSDNKNHSGKRRVRLLSSFSKTGSFSLPVSESFEKIRICGKYRSASLFISVIKVIAENSGLIRTLLPSALNGNSYDGILTDDRAYIIDCDGISADDFLTKFSAEEESELSDLERIHDELLRLAVVHFSRASDIHFSLEDIYSSLMNYSKNEEKLGMVKSLCAEALGF